MTESYPLYWPEGRPRARRRQQSRFKCGFGQAVREVTAELKRLGARNCVISTNVPTRRDGLPLASAKRPQDPGVAVYFRYNDQRMVLACDRWDRVEDNLWAIAKTIDAIRGIERWGSGDMMSTALSGFQALPPPGGEHWRTVLGVGAGATLAECEARFRHLARSRHPDHGGSSAAMAELNSALAIARQELRA